MKTLVILWIEVLFVVSILYVAAGNSWVIICIIAINLLYCLSVLWWWRYRVHSLHFLSGAQLIITVMYTVHHRYWSCCSVNTMWFMTVAQKHLEYAMKNGCHSSEMFLPVSTHTFLSQNDCFHHCVQSDSHQTVAHWLTYCVVCMQCRCMFVLGVCGTRWKCRIP